MRTRPVLALTALALAPALLCAAPRARADGEFRPHQNAPHAENIDAAIRFLESANHPWRWTWLVVLDHLQRRYGLDPKLAVSATYDPKPWHDPAAYPVGPYGRLAWPDHDYPIIPPSETMRLEELLRHALYCDRLGGGPALLERLKTKLAQCDGKRGVFYSHAVARIALAYRWMEENGCIPENGAGFADSLDGALRRAVERNGPDSVQGAEAMAMLCYLGRGSQLAGEWLPRLLAAQRPDGGWAPRPEISVSDGVTSVMALWVMLDAALPDTPPAPWIRRPGGGAPPTPPQMIAPHDSGPWPPPGDPRPHADSPHARNIDRALKFLIDDPSDYCWVNLAMLDFFRRKFGLHDRYRIEITHGPKTWLCAETVPMESGGRMADPGHHLDHAPLPEDPNFEDFMRVAAYADQYPEPEDFLERMRTAFEADLGRGGVYDYHVTHYALAFQWLVENGRAERHPGAEKLRMDFSDALVEIIVRNGPATDIGLEALAFLYYLGFGNRVFPEWLEAAADAQRPDGGWSFHPGGEPGEADGHPTVLALWALLEAAVPNAPNAPWIQPLSGPEAAP